MLAALPTAAEMHLELADGALTAGASSDLFFGQKSRSRPIHLVYFARDYLIKGSYGGRRGYENPTERTWEREGSFFDETLWCFF